MVNTMAYTPCDGRNVHEGAFPFLYRSVFLIYIQEEALMHIRVEFLCDLVTPAASQGNSIWADMKEESGIIHTE